jgi:hypothetical protein
VQVRSLDQPDEMRSFPNGAVEMVTIADTMIGRARFQPGHDGWVVGDEPRVTVDFSQAMADYAKPGGAA